MKKRVLCMAVIVCLAATAWFGLVTGQASVAEAEESEARTSKTQLDGSLFNDPQGRLRFDGMRFDADIEESDYLHIMPYATASAMWEWLEALRFDFDNDEDAAWINENTNKIIFKAIDIGIIDDFFNAPPTRWDSKTHEKTMQKVFDLLGPNDTLYKFYNNMTVYYKYNSGSATGPAREALYKMAYQPDYSENVGNGMSGTHYYIAYNATPSINGAYYQNKNDNYSRSARTRVEDHYSMAIACYKNGDIQTAIKYLGYASHYLMDLGITLHTTGISGAPHSTYEGYVNGKFEPILHDDFHATNGNPNNVKDITYLYKSTNPFANGFEFPLNTLADFSANGTITGTSVSYYTALYTKRTSTTDQETYYDPVVKETLPKTEQYVAALLKQFKDDVENPNSDNYQNAIQSGATYSIKNAIPSGLYMNTEGTNNNSLIKLRAASNGPEQKYMAIYTTAQNYLNDSYFRFAPANASTKKLRAQNSVSSLEINTVGNFPIIDEVFNFKPTYLGNGKYRIMARCVAKPVQYDFNRDADYKQSARLLLAIPLCR
ncbi:MAG: hypothetical protein FWD58_03860 [Firmicutes bacterium]|nr:hypothetical protein [Bacillota bacterium]